MRTLLENLNKRREIKGEPLLTDAVSRCAVCEEATSASALYWYRSQSWRCAECHPDVDQLEN